MHFILNSSGKDFIAASIAYITINGEHFLSYQDKKLREPYINFVYYDLFQRFINEDKIRHGICHVCSEGKNVIGKISLPLKFYGTTNSLYFYALSNSRAYQSFSICEDCLKDVFSGMNYVEQELNDKLFGIYKGVIEDNNDPEKMGRCKIRVIGIHSPNKTKKNMDGVPTDEIPWAEPALGLFEGSVTGFGA